MSDAARNRLVFWISAAAAVGITIWSAVALGVDIPALLRNLGRARRILGDSFPPDVSFLPRLIGPFVETLQIAVIGTVIGALVALPLAILAARPVAPAYTVNRIIGRIPIIGQILSGSRSDAALAATFSVSGAVSDPQIGVNPLAALVPGMVRDLFSAFTADAADSGRTDDR